MALTTTDVTVSMGVETLLAWIEFRHKTLGGVDEVYVWAEVALTDAPTYFEGYKEARVVSFGNITMGLSDRSGQMPINSVEFTLSDIPDASGNMLLRGFLGDDDTLGVIDVEVVIRLISDADRRTGQTPVTVFRGVVTDYQALEPYLFRFQCRDWIGSRLRTRITPPVVNTTDFPDAPAWTIGKTIPIVYGDVTDTAEAVPQGMVWAIPVGPFTALDASSWYGFVVAAHAVKAVDEIYGYSSLGAIVPFTINDVLWTAPGSGGFAALFGDPYYDAPSGRRYTLIYISLDEDPNADASAEAHGTSQAVNLRGVEAVGDGSGALLTSIYDQKAHFEDNYVLPTTSYAGGNWAASIPTWLDGTAKRSSSAYSAAKTAAATAMPAGDDGAWLVYGPTDTRDLLAAIAVSGDCDQAISKDGQLGIFIDNPASITSRLTETSHIIVGSFGLSGSKQDFANIASANYKPKYITTTTPAEQVTDDYIALQLLASVEDDDTDSIDRHGEVPTDPVDLIARSDASQAAEVIARRVARTAEPRQVVKECGLHHMLSDGLTAGCMIEVTHRQGATQTGWTDKELYVRQAVISLSELKMQLICADLEAGSP